VTRPTAVEIDADAIAHNVAFVAQRRRAEHGGARW
jgi:hypothetical protein